MPGKKTISQSILSKNIGNQSYLFNPEQVEAIINLLKEEIKKELAQGNRVKLTGFGTFETYIRNARYGPDPLNPKEKIYNPEIPVAKFRTGSRLKQFLKDSYGEKR